MPCSIRDHFWNFKKNIISKDTKPEDAYAGEAIKSDDYQKFLENFDKELMDKTLPIWKREYLGED